MRTLDSYHEWLPWTLFITFLVVAAASWIALFVAMAFWPA
jgi:hypothetical protein